MREERVYFFFFVDPIFAILTYKRRDFVCVLYGMGRFRMPQCELTSCKLDYHAPNIISMRLLKVVSTLIICYEFVYRPYLYDVISLTGVSFAEVRDILAGCELVVLCLRSLENDILPITLHDA